MAKGKKYSAAEKRAYYRAQGFAAARAGKLVNCRTKNEKASFDNGLKSNKGAK